MTYPAERNVTWKLVTAPAVEPVSLAEAKAYCRIDAADEDALVVSLGTAARQYVEEYTGRQLVTATWKLTADAFPSCCGGKYRFGGSVRNDAGILLPRPPLLAVSSVAYSDTNGTTQTWGSSNYVVDTQSEPGRVVPAYNMSWPDTYDQANAVAITYTCGYGAAGSAVPEPIRLAMRLLIVHWFDNRGVQIVGTIGTDIKFAVDALLAPYRVFYP